MSAGVSRGILELARAGRISATSAMTVAPDWSREAPALIEVADRISVGLHLTLSEFGPLGPMPRFAPDGRFPLLRLTARSALLGRLPRTEIAAEIARQLDAFEAAFGRPPDFVDGHQHAHTLPGVRGPLLSVLAARGLAGRVWLRDPFDTPGPILVRGGPVKKALVVAALSLGFGRQARRAGFSTNRGFAGFSSFRPGDDLRAIFPRFLAAPGPAHLIMCHPGHVEPGERLDGVAETRRQELAYLASDDFAALLDERGVKLVRSPENS